MAAKASRKPSNKASDSTDWQTVENVVAALERIRATIPGIVVTPKAQLPRLTDPSDTRDVDVLVEVPVAERTLRIGIEVKGKGRPITMDQMGTLVDLRRDIPVDRFCVVSKSGFSRGARRKASENGVELHTLEEFQTSDTWICDPGTRVLRRGGQILHALFQFPEAALREHGDQLEAALRGRPHDDIKLADAHGTATSTQVMSAALHEHLAHRATPIQDGDAIRITVDLRGVENLRMRIAEQVFPGPDSIVVEARYDVVTEHVPERRFRTNGIEVSTARLRLFEQFEQVSIAVVPQTDGTKQLVLSRGPAHPKKVRR